MAQRLRALATLPEDPVSIPSTNMGAHNCLQLSPRGSDIHAGKTTMYIKKKSDLRIWI